MYEGGVRGVALLHSPLSDRQGQVKIPLVTIFGPNITILVLNVTLLVPIMTLKSHHVAI